MQNSAQFAYFSTAHTTTPDVSGVNSTILDWVVMGGMPVPGVQQFRCTGVGAHCKPSAVEK
jgi:hypothetical protein